MRWRNIYEQTKIKAVSHTPKQKHQRYTPQKRQQSFISNQPKEQSIGELYFNRNRTPQLKQNLQFKKLLANEGKADKLYRQAERLIEEIKIMCSGVKKQLIKMMKQFKDASKTMVLEFQKLLSEKLHDELTRNIVKHIPQVHKECKIINSAQKNTLLHNNQHLTQIESSPIAKVTQIKKSPMKQSISSIQKSNNRQQFLKMHTRNRTSHHIDKEQPTQLNEYKNFREFNKQRGKSKKFIITGQVTEQKQQNKKNKKLSDSLAEMSTCFTEMKKILI